MYLERQTEYFVQVAGVSLAKLKSYVTLGCRRHRTVEQPEHTYQPSNHVVYSVVLNPNVFSTTREVYRAMPIMKNMRTYSKRVFFAIRLLFEDESAVVVMAMCFYDTLFFVSGFVNTG